MLNTRTGSGRAGLYYMLLCFLMTGLLLMLLPIHKQLEKTTDGH
jgi:hypothetical protein